MMNGSQIQASEEVSKPQKSGLIYSLAKVSAVHHLVSILGLYKFGNVILEKFPIIRKLPSHRNVIRINSIAAVALSEEMFSGSGYLGIFEKIQVNTFIDLGCNIGWFPCLLAESSKSNKFSGLMFDADPRVIEHAKWHLKTNGFTGCEVLHGLVGVEAEEEEACFYINPANTQSAAKMFGENHPFPIKGKVQEMKVPVFRVANEWILRHGDKRIDLLKIDIEGAELDFIRYEIDFIKKYVRYILCEWHNWHVTFKEINDFLEKNGFKFNLVTEQDENGGVAVYENQSLLDN